MLAGFLTYLRTNIQFLFLLALWLLVGLYGSYSVYVVVPLSLILLKNKGRYKELLLGFLFMIVLSDRVESSFGFAANLKSVYILLLSAFILLDRKQFEPFNTLYQRFIPFFAVAVVSAFLGDFFFIAIQKTLSYFLLLLVVPNYITQTCKKNKYAFFRNLFYFISCLLFLGLILLVLSPETAIMEGRYRGVFGNSNGLGLFCALIFMLFTLLIDKFKNLF
ncbi:MAG: hypothetical protein ACE5DN_03040, partial [Flavobacteriales bacterium]